MLGKAASIEDQTLPLPQVPTVKNLREKDSSKNSLTIEWEGFQQLDVEIFILLDSNKILPSKLTSNTATFR